MAALRPYVGRFPLLCHVNRFQLNSGFVNLSPQCQFVKQCSIGYITVSYADETCTRHSLTAAYG